VRAQPLTGVFQRVGQREDQAACCRIERVASIAHRREQRLHTMARPLDQADAHRPGRAFQAVHRAEQRRHQGVVRRLRVLVDGAQRLIQRLDVLLELVEEGHHQALEQLRLIHPVP